MTVHHCLPEHDGEGIAQALARAQPGDEVVLAAGRYRVRATLNVSQAVTLRGPAFEAGSDAEPTAVLVGSVPDGPVLAVTGNGFRLRGVRVEVDAALPADAACGEQLLQAHDVQDFRVQDCRFHGGGRAGGGVEVHRGHDVNVGQCVLEGFDVDQTRSALGMWSVIGVLLRGNKVLGGCVGIYAGRDHFSPNLASEAIVVDNQCGGARHVGIWYQSSSGQVKGNECRNSKTAGILVQRSPESLGEPSRVNLIGNRCHSNEGAGIVFYSSNGQIEGNECWGSKFLCGILVDRDPQSPGEPSHAEVIGNICHENAKGGIVFMSCAGRIEDNECWGHGGRPGSGIQVQRADDAPDGLPNEPSKVMVVGNRCHGNSSGIQFSSSDGRIEGNECWDSTFVSGIGVQRSADPLSEPSRVDVIGNRCHGNAQGGIIFFSSEGRVEGNECWDARTLAGIMVQRRFDSTGGPSTVDVSENRCHGNDACGINFFSSEGRIEGNDCWGNRATGIQVQRDDELLQPSRVDVIKNRSHQNARYGIVFLESAGSIDHAVTGGNALGTLLIEGEPRPRIMNPPEDAPIPLSYFEDLRCDKHPLKSWLLRRSPDALTLALADAVVASPSVRRIAELERQVRQARAPVVPPMGTATADPPNVVDTAQVGQTLYVLRRVASASPEKPETLSVIRPKTADVPWISPADGNGVPSLNALWKHVSQPVDAARQARTRWPWRARPAARHHVAALVSANGPQFENWLSRRSEVVASPRGRLAPARTRVTVFDGQALSAQQPAPPRGDKAAATRAETDCSLASAHLSSLTLGQRFRIGLVAVPLAPFRHLLAMALALLVAGGVLLARVSEALSGNVGVVPPIAPWPAWAELWNALRLDTEAALHQLAATAGRTVQVAWQRLGSDDKVREAVLWPPLTGLALAAVFYVNRLLPGRMLLSIDNIIEWLDVPFLKGVVKWLTRRERGLRFLSRLLRSRSAQRLWLKHHVYGHAWRRCWPLRPPAALLVLRDVDTLSDTVAEELRLVAAMAPRRQPLLVVVQMPGLSMLVGGFLDVWAKAPAEGPQAWVLHDASSTQIPERPLPRDESADAGAAEVADKQVLQTLARILGWRALVPQDTASDQGFADLGADLVRAGVPRPTVWPAALVLGSTPQAPMVLAVKIGTGNDELINEMKPVGKHLGLEDDAPWTTLFESASRLAQAVEAADGLLLVDKTKTKTKTRRRLWVGRVGWRLALATAIRQRFAADDEAGAVARGEELLCRWLAAAESHHLDRATDGLKFKTEQGDLKPTLVEAKAELARLEANLADGQATSKAQAVELDTLRKRLAEIEKSAKAARARALLHLEAAIGLARERLSLQVAAAVQSGRSRALQADWQKLVNALCSRAPASEGAKATEAAAAPSVAWSAAHAVRAWGAVWCWQALPSNEAAQPPASAGAVAGLPSPSHWLQALEPGAESPPPDSPPSFRVLWDDLADLADTLSALPPAQAEALWQRRLKQDWQCLPADLHAALSKQGPPPFPARAVQRLRLATSVDALWSAAARLGERPWLVVQALMVLGAADARRWLGGDRESRRQLELEKLAGVAEGVWTLLQALPDLLAKGTPTAGEVPAPDDALPPGWVPGPRDPGTAAARALLADPAAIQSLADALRAARGRTLLREAELADTGAELEGIALGVHGSLHRMLQEMHTGEAQLAR